MGKAKWGFEQKEDVIALKRLALRERNNPNKKESLELPSRLQNTLRAIVAVPKTTVPAASIVGGKLVLGSAEAFIYNRDQDSPNDLIQFLHDTDDKPVTETIYNLCSTPFIPTGPADADPSLDDALFCTQDLDGDYYITHRCDFAGNGGGFTVTDVKTGDFTASPGTFIPYDTTGGSFTITLDPTATIGDKYELYDVGGSTDTFPLFISGNGNSLHGVATAGQPLEQNLPHAGTTIVVLETGKYEFVAVPRGLAKSFNFLKTSGVFYPLNDNLSDKVIVDASGSFNGVSSRDTDLYSSTDSKVNRSLLFTASDFFDIDALAAAYQSAGETKVTLAVWLKASGLSGVRRIMDFSDGSTNNRLLLGASNGIITFGCSVSGVSQWTLQTTAQAIFTGTYALLIATHNGTEAQIFVDDVKPVQNFTTSLDKTALFGDTSGINALRIGRSTFGTAFNWVGEMDIAVVQNEAFLPTDRTGLFNNGNGTETTSGLLL